MRRVRYGLAITHKIVKLENFEAFRSFMAKTPWTQKNLLFCHDHWDLRWTWDSPREVYLGTHEGLDAYLESNRKRY